MFAISFMQISAPAAEAVLDASPPSFTAFYDRALPGVYGYFLYRCGGSAAVAEDLTQETFLAAVIELKKGKRVRRPSAWLYGIARHKLLDYYRLEQRTKQQLASASELEDVDEEPFTPDDSDARERATAALASVAASQRAALVLCYVDGYSVPEAARLLGRSTEAVDSLLARGRQMFKRAYLNGEA
jgi:RNA polymerase sigma-70 factor, ECF subfamily